MFQKRINSKDKGADSLAKLAGVCVVLPILGLTMGVDSCGECIDEDGDGYGEGSLCAAIDCDDSDASVHGYALENCSDGVDNDCDGLVDVDDLECNDARMVQVPAGEFLRGICNNGSDPACSEGEPGYSSTYSEPEFPMRAIYLDDFRVDAFEVSVADYRSCVEAGACAPANFESYNRYTICHYDKPEHENHPMNCVGWFGAEEYCRYAGQRLPSEAEWEKAARGTGGPTYPWGSESPTCNLANYSNATNQYCRGGTAPVTDYPAGISVYGAFNMAGNVWEWVADWYHPDYYDYDFPQADYSPEDNPAGPQSGEYKLIRGGSWVSSSAFMRSTFKHFYTPITATEDLGFRCVKAGLQD